MKNYLEYIEEDLETPIIISNVIKKLIENNNIGELKSVIEENSIDVNLINIDNGADYYCSPLIWSVRNNKKNIIKYLISIGADVKIADTYNQNVLHWMSINSFDSEIFDLFVSKGVDINAIKKLGGEPVLINTASNNNKEMVSRMLELDDLDIFAKDESGRDFYDCASPEIKIIIKEKKPDFVAYKEFDLI